MNLTSYQRKILERLNANEVCLYEKQWGVFKFVNDSESLKLSQVSNFHDLGFLKLSAVAHLFIDELVQRTTQGAVALELTEKGKALFL